MTEIVLVLTTVAADGELLARQLVDERLAACVNLLPPMVSFYRWQGAVARDAEQQLVIKTTRDRLAALEERVRALHAYELPEWIVIAADQASEAYAAWLTAQVAAAD
jgi:periplasmic divalent cation tolerance protein